MNAHLYLRGYKDLLILSAIAEKIGIAYGYVDLRWFDVLTAHTFVLKAVAEDTILSKAMAPMQYTFGDTSLRLHLTP